MSGQIALVDDCRQQVGELYIKINKALDLIDNIQQKPMGSFQDPDGFYDEMLPDWESELDTLASSVYTMLTGKEVPLENKNENC